MIHLNYDGKQDNGIIFNTSYPNGALYKGIEYRPTLTFHYDSFQYSEVFDAIDYVEADGVKKVMTPEQANEVKLIATGWVQPLGQEGNPNDEQKLEIIKQNIQSHLDNKAVELGFDNINSISKYMGFVNPYQVEAEALASWTANVWFYVEAQLVEMQSGNRVIPTNEEAILELPTYGA